MSDDTIDPPVDADFEALVGRLMTETTAEVAPSPELDRRVAALSTARPRHRRGLVAAATLTAAAMIGLVVWWQQDDGTVVTTPADDPPSLWDTIGTDEWTELPLPPVDGPIVNLLTKATETGLLAVVTTGAAGWVTELLWLGPDLEWVTIEPAGTTASQREQPMWLVVAPVAQPSELPSNKLWLHSGLDLQLATIDLESRTYTTKSYGAAEVAQMMGSAPNGRDMWFVDQHHPSPLDDEPASISFTAFGPDADAIPPLVADRVSRPGDDDQWPDVEQLTLTSAAGIWQSPHGTPVVVTNWSLHDRTRLDAWKLTGDRWTRVASSPEWQLTNPGYGYPMGGLSSEFVAMIGPESGEPTGRARVVSLRFEADGRAHWVEVPPPNEQCPWTFGSLLAFGVTRAHCIDGTEHWLDRKTWRSLPRQDTRAYPTTLRENVDESGAFVLVDLSIDETNPSPPDFPVRGIEAIRVEPGG
ncbi:MAG TPA: hypothetical protein VJM33_19300 [Microthrixaceae bacterium]|nr:hypothetical protein [Microthrixaceae bacterium]